MNNISAINGFESNKIALILKNINFKIDKKELLKNISFRVIKRKITVIMGANGSGKSLCLKLITGLLKPSSGLIDFNKNLQIGYVPQKVVFLRRNVYQNLIYSLKILSKPKNIINERITEIMHMCDISNLFQISARKLSVGQQQLLAILRALILKPNFLLLDEPCSNLDPYYTKIIEDILTKAKKNGVTIILVTHDLNQARRLADEIIFIHNGNIYEQTKNKNFFINPFSKQAKDYISGRLIK
tara:strand:+ start:356 stop:1084 length:729 start_codon:yes stop_codon:yes gene_type:complete